MFKPPTSLSLFINDTFHDVSVKRHARARRLTLRVDPLRRICLTVPRRCSEQRMLIFLNSQTEWVQQQLLKAPARIGFAPGLVFPLRGEPHLLQHDEHMRGLARIENKTVFIGGNIAHLSRRLRDFLKKEAQHDFREITARYAKMLNVHVKRIQLRDTRSRWGSCNREGVICYSWRLIFAPDFVLDYLCAHEVAHLRHMDHSAKFWSLVESICPHTNEARTWLKANGAMLLAMDF